jgi:hypothetical protein
MKDQKRPLPRNLRELTLLGFEITQDGSKIKTSQARVSPQSLSTVKPQICRDKLDMHIRWRTKGRPAAGAWAGEHLPVFQFRGAWSDIKSIECQQSSVHAPWRLASQMRMITMNRSQEIDHAYHEERLLVLLARRQKLPATSNQMPGLDLEILAVWNLVRSYRMVQARQHFKAALEPAEASRIDSAGRRVGGAKNSASHTVWSGMCKAPAA